MRYITLLICSLSFFVVAHNSWGADYTGIWKSNCADYFGVQIKHVDNSLYSISFCGLDGCFEPGQWAPNSKNDGDPQYKVISPEKIGIRRKDDKNEYFTYIKCTSNPTWTVQPPPVDLNEKTIDCSFDNTSKDDGVLIAWITTVRKTTLFKRGSKSTTTTVGSFRPIAMLTGSSLKETLGATIHKGQSFWPLLSPSAKPIKLQSVSSFLDHMGEDHCVYSGTLEKSDLSRWTLLSSKPLPDIFRAPTKEEQEGFYRLNTSCVQQGDYPAGQAPPCVRPTLLVVSEINKNGKLEYWATEPYLWDTGLTVWEINTGKLIQLLQICVGCSD